ncbi:hypothetical protein CA236_09810 [Sphingomonas sp. ABOLG]|uniref:hypothetical protein n=1 Tax=Sphingomonas sp. ABOLG TaxID=1985880 RepID=UPI000F7ED268|nr:hypothetical protein [Sphingomonas sp. ABOLG]RSV17631.1 hypothetical protein CA236_09810 [Sphingomonas sp. ABOLG]
MYRTAFLLLAAATPLAANAQTAPAPQAGAAAPAAGAAKAAAPTVGATVVDTQGNTVGTIASTDGTNAVVDTGTVKAAVPLSSFGTGPKGPTLAMTKAELEAAAGQGAAQAAAQFQSQLTTGATVYGAGGTSVGTIKAVEGEFVTLTTPKGDARLPKGSFGPGPQGVTIGMTAAQLDAAMAGK